MVDLIPIILLIGVYWPLHSFVGKLVILETKGRYFDLPPFYLKHSALYTITDWSILVTCIAIGLLYGQFDWWVYGATAAFVFIFSGSEGVNKAYEAIAEGTLTDRRDGELD